MHDKNLASLGYFEHYISLGHCCYVSEELQRLGLRDASMPFDWVRTRWKAIEYSFANNFNNYLNYDSLFQKKSTLHIYKNLDYGVGFVHDFVDNKSLKSQIGAVRKKYKRRIERFWLHTSEPTLFIRYMWDYDELVYVSTHYDEIETMIKKYNAKNEIIFISHDTPKNIDVSAIKLLFFITKPDDDELNTQPLSSNKELFSFLKNVNYSKREANLKFNEHKESEKKAKAKTISGRLKRKFQKFKKSHLKKYIHTQQC